MKTALRSLAVALLAASGATAVRAQTHAAPPLPAYVKQADGVTSEVVLVAGTAEFDAVARSCGALYLRAFPQTRMELQGSDSIHAVGRLLDTPGCIGLMSRPMRENEADSLRGKCGSLPIALRVAADFVVVCVHKDNPLAHTGLSLEQLDAVFSKTRKAGGAEDIRTWGQLGVGGAWAHKPITLYACARASPLTDFFVHSVMRGGEFKDSVLHTVRDGEAADGVATNPVAIGFSSLRVCGNAVALLPASAGQGGAPVQPAPANFGAYPLTRYVYAYVAVRTGETVGGNQREMLKTLLSREGQAAAAQSGYVPVPFDFARGELAGIGVSLAPAADPAAR